MSHYSYLTASQQKTRKKNLFILSILTILIIITFIISMNTGVIKLTPMVVLSTLFGQGEAQQQLIGFDLGFHVLLLLC